jgi:aspartokinase/homoserine dehydrogenase 1
VGAALQAETIVIHTDVHGVLSADPRRVPNAVTLSQLSFSDAVRMAQAGAQVLHPHTLAPVRGTATTVWVAHGAASGPRTRMHELARTTQLSLVRTDDAIVAVGPGHATLPEALGCRSLGADLRPQQTRCPVNDDDALRHAHRALVETQRVADVFVLGAGTVGSALIDQLADRRHRLVGVGTRSKLAFDPEGVTSWRGLAAVGAWSREALLDRLARCPLPVLVDCTAADTTALYRAAFARDIHVVTANKGPIAGEPTLRDGPIWFGTTVGAAVPVLETLRGLQRGGRAVHTVEGCFSGTLAFVCDAVLGGLDFDDAVAEAQRQGLTEPDPAEDLSGRDVARKARIVADELGLEGPIALEPLTREAMATCVQQARVLGGAVRYLARLSDDLRIGLVAVPPDHPAMARRAGEAWCAFTTDDGPVVVRGPGAGPVVTASGLLDDLDRACLVAPTRERRRHA